MLKVSRGMIYYIFAESPRIDATLENDVIEIFNKSRKNYGTKKIKEKLKQPVSRHKIGEIMAKYGLVSKYTLKHYKRHHTGFNEEPIENIVDRKFDNRAPLEVVISDLTYVPVNNSRNYLCAIIDLNNREIIGYSAGKSKTAKLVKEAIQRIKRPLSDIKIFHTDRGSEFKNKEIDDIISTFGITRSLSHKGCPYDNAVAEATYNIIKTEFVFGENFSSLQELSLKFFDYVNWYNTQRIHGSLGYLSPVDFRQCK